MERTLTNARYAARNGDARQAATLLECSLANARNASVRRNDTVFTTANQNFFFCLNEAIIFAMINGISFFHINACQIVAGRKCPFPDARCAFWNSDVR